MSTEQVDRELNEPGNEEADSLALAAEQQAAVSAWLLAHPYGDQDENGIALSAIP